MTVMTAEERVTAIVDAFNAAAITTIATKYGSVTLATVEAMDGNPRSVHVQAGFLYQQDFYIGNPPVYIEDPNGTENVNGTMYRYDPLATIAETVAMNGGGS